MFCYTSQLRYRVIHVLLRLRSVYRLHSFEIILSDCLLSQTLLSLTLAASTDATTENQVQFIGAGEYSLPLICYQLLITSQR